MLSVLMAIATVLLVLGFCGNLFTFLTFVTIGNNVGITVCYFIFVLYLGIVIGCIYFYNLNKCETFLDEKKDFEREISHLNEDKEWYERQLKSYKKFEKYAKERNDYESKQRELEEENKKLRSIIQTQNNVKTEDFEQYLKVIMEDKK